MKSEIKENIVLTSTIGITIFITFFIASFIFINTTFTNSIYDRFIDHVKTVNVYSTDNILPIIKDEKNDIYIPFFNNSSIKADFTKSIYFNDFRNYDFYSKKTGNIKTGYFNKDCVFINADKSTQEKLYLYIQDKKIKCRNNKIITDELLLYNSKIFGNGTITYVDISNKVRHIKNQIDYFLRYYLMDFLYHNNSYLIEKFLIDEELIKTLLKTNTNTIDTNFITITSIEDFSNYEIGKLFYKINYTVLKYNTSTIGDKKEIKRICKIKLEFNNIPKKNDLNIYITSLSDTYNLVKKDKDNIINIINQNIYKIINGNISEKIKTLSKIMINNKRTYQLLKTTSTKKKDVVIQIIKDIIRNENIVSVNSIIVDRLDDEQEYIAKVSLTNQLNDNIRFNFYFIKRSENDFRIFFIDKE
jgi:hypothetical protein